MKLCFSTFCNKISFINDKTLVSLINKFGNNEMCVKENYSKANKFFCPFIIKSIPTYPINQSTTKNKNF